MKKQIKHLHKKKKIKNELVYLELEGPKTNLCIKIRFIFLI
jgi:hypothetical protein